MSFFEQVNKTLRALRMDGWKSTLGGLGSRSDRGRPGSVSFIDQPTLTDYELSAAYRNLWLVRKLVEARPDEALRKGFGLEAGLSEAAPNFERLNYSGYHTEGAFERALVMAELKGGAGIYLGVNEGNPEALLEPIADGAEIAFLECFDRFQLTGQDRERSPDAPNFDQPTTWTVTGNRRSSLRFHTSRLIRFTGAPLPTDHGLTEQDRDWGDSVLQAVWADVQRYGVFWQSVAHLMQLSSVGVLKVAGLIEMLASENQDAARDRVDLLNESMSIARLMLLDAKHDESYHREAVSFTDMPALLDKLEQNTAGAFGIPAAVLFGRAPAGLNATGESDMRCWYDDVATYQQRKVKPGLERLLAATDGLPPGEVEFEPLWQLSEKEQAESRKVTIDANERLWTMGVIGESEIRKAMHEGKPIEEVMSGKPPADAGPVAQANAMRPEPAPEVEAPEPDEEPEELAPPAAPFPPAKE